MSKTHKFKIAYLSEIASDHEVSGQIKTVKNCSSFPSQTIISEPLYGDLPDDLEKSAPLQDVCQPGVFTFLPAQLYQVEHCIVWSKFGLIIIGPYVVRESTWGFPAHLMQDVKFEGSPEHFTYCNITFDDQTMPKIDSAINMLAGIQENYYHWLMFVIAKFDPFILYGSSYSGSDNPVVIVPDDLMDYQAVSLDLMCNFYDAKKYEMGMHDFITVKNLSLPMIYPYGGLTPLPIIKRPFMILENLLELKIKKLRMIYISRRDSTNRVLQNEKEVENLLREFGFEIICLTEMTIQDQASRFASATHVVAPHGAGLTNVVFCRPGTKVLEIHADAYVNWCYRRICNLYHLNYGYIYGNSTIKNPASLHTLSFELPMEKLMHVLIDKNFITF